jgi:hypothetical protein
MENAPVITLNGVSPYPGVDSEIWERYTRWSTEVYIPLMMKNTTRRGIDVYEIIKENPLYPFRLGIHHHESLTSLKDIHRTPQQLDY